MATDGDDGDGGYERRDVRAGNLSVRTLVAGSGDRLALLLHGFPDGARSMEPLLDRFADAGFTAVAPYLRGYDGTDPAPNGRYLTLDLARDAAALVDALGHETAVLIGHDWGGNAAYLAGTLAPERFSHLVPLSVPPPGSRGIRWALRNDPAQLRRAWYKAFFQLPWLPERALRAADFALVEWLWRDWSPGWEPPEGRLADVKETFRQEGTVEAALAYYRDRFRANHVPWLVSAADDQAHLASTPIEVPTLVVGGADDGCIGTRLYRDAGDAFAGPWQLELLDGVGHFVHLEAPDRVADLALEFVT